MEEYKPNSHKYKEEQKQLASSEKRKVEKVVSGNVKVRKNEMRKVADVFISEDVHKVKNYILMDVLIPAVKKAISDIITNGIDMILYGEGGRTRKTNNASNVSYRSYYDRRREDEVRYNRPIENRARCSSDELVFDTRAEAEEVVTRMGELIDTYGVVSVADMYDMAGISCDYTYNKYGWTSVNNAVVMSIRGGGYIIKLPKAMLINA